MLNKEQLIKKVLRELVYYCSLEACEDCPFGGVSCKMETPTNWVYDGILSEDDFLEEKEKENANTNH